MRLVIPIPSDQGRVGRIFEQFFSCRRFDVTITKEHVDLLLMAQTAAEIITRVAHKGERVTLAYRHHFSGGNDL